jgi:hypothetical protein
LTRPAYLGHTLRMRRRPAPASRRIFAAFLASLWTFSLLASLWHGLQETHVYCVEHGTFEEAGELGASPARAPSAGLSVESSLADERSEHHEACAFFDCGNLATLGDEPPVDSVTLLAAGHAPVVGLTDAFSPIDLLHLAPKASPPAAVVSILAFT